MSSIQEAERRVTHPAVIYTFTATDTSSYRLCHFVLIQCSQRGGGGDVEAFEEWMTAR